MDFSVLFAFTAFVVGSLIIGILLKRHQDLSHRFLAFFLFTLTYYSFTIFLYNSKYIFEAPYLLRSGALITCLTAPALYFYVVFALKRRSKLAWTDLIHLLPALIFLVDYFPFFISSNSEKIKLIETFYQDVRLIISFREGWLLPKGSHYILKEIIALGYVCYSSSLLFRNVRWQRKKARINVHLMNWLKFNVMMFGLFTMIGLLCYCSSIWIRYGLITTLWQPLIMFSVLGIILLFNPEILYGTYDNDNAEPHTDATKRLVIDKVISLQVKDTLDEFIARRQYLRQNIRIKEVGEELGIQPYVLSAFINQLYQMRFNDYINKYRVEYIKDGLLNGEWSQLTLEAIAEEAGFTNRTTFLNAFKKFTGVTPTVFMQENKKQHSIKVASF